MKKKTLEIETLAIGILKKRQDKIDADFLKKEQEYADKVTSLLHEFNAAFAHYLDKLKQAGIKWCAKFNDKNYPELSGGYIEFTRNNKTLKMDFINGSSYRYEYTGNRLKPNAQPGKMIFSNWETQDFILFIYNGLIKEN